MAPKRKAADKADAPSKSKVAKKAEKDSAPAAAAATGGVVIEACKS